MQCGTACVQPRPPTVQQQVLPGQGAEEVDAQREAVHAHAGEEAAKAQSAGGKGEPGGEGDDAVGVHHKHVCTQRAPHHFF